MKATNFGSDEEFIANYQKLKSSRKMAELYNCSHGAVLNYAKKIGYSVKNNKELKITNIPIEQVIKEYEELLSCEKVGELHDCSGTAVRKYLTKNGYQLENHGAKLKNLSEEEFIKNYRTLKSAQKMGEKYNCSATAILQFAKKIGYDVNENHELKLTKENIEEILKGYNDFTSYELAEKYNVSRNMITKLWHDNNLVNKKIITKNTAEIDLTNQKFGMWTVMHKTDKRNAGGIIYWHCKCDCGIEKDVLGSSLRNGTSLSCGSHHISKGNIKIRQLLEKANIPFEIEKKFDTCKDQLPMPFDFFVNNKYLIEYDGCQHYQEDTIYNYEYTHKHDIMKSDWCKQNNIPLIRIPYTHYEDLTLDDLILEKSSFVE